VWQRRDDQLRRQRDAQWEADLARKQEERDRHRATWENDSDDIGSGIPKPVPPPCERCGQSVTGQPGQTDEFTPPEDGRHCPQRRTGIQMQPTTLRKALFGKRQ